MKNNIRHSTRNGVVLLAAFTMVATSTLQVSAASPEDSTTTTQEVAPSTTVDAPPTTLGGPSTTLGGSSTNLAEAIEEQLPLGEVSESRKGIDLLTTSSSYYYYSSCVARSRPASISFTAFAFVKYQKKPCLWEADCTCV